MPDQSAAWVAASRLVRRTGFGSTGPLVDQVVQQGTTVFVDQILAAPPDPDDAPALTEQLPGGMLTETQKTQLKADAKVERAELVGWWVRRMAGVRQPAPEKLTFVWHDHFATSLAKVRFPFLMLQQNRRLRAEGRGDFRTLALSMLTDAATVRWLDGQKSTGKAPNENLAREFMELFALGHGGGYTENDVRNGALALTGWTIDPDGTTTFVPKRHYDGSVSVLGRTGPMDLEGFCDAVLAHPASAPFVTTSLWSLLVSPSPPSATTLEALVSAYGEGRDLTALLRRMLGGPELATAEGSLVVPPVEWTIGLLRALKVPLSEDKRVKAVVTVLRTLGQLPFYPPSVGGWPSGQAWLSTAAVTTRMRAAAVFAGSGDLSSVEQATGTARLDAAAYLLGVGGWSDASAAALKPLAGSPPRLVAAAANTPEYLVH